ncbi:MAG: zinc ribbon domain-containing protein [Clostridiales bacterium]|nr:zinc ribbon domain-containing protein [Candidatus Blautia equi]
MADKKLEGLWDCPYCGAKGIGGLTKHCPACGHPQDTGTKFYLGEKKKYLDEELAEQYGQGADWTCAYCGSLNRIHYKYCTNCSAPKEDSQTDYHQNVVNEEIKEQKKMAERAEAHAPQQQPKKRSFLPLLFLIVAIVGLVAFFGRAKGADVKIFDKSWERNIDIEALKTFKESDWDVPSGGRVTGQKREIHHYQQILDHYEEVPHQVSKQVYDGEDSHTDYKDNGDGTFTEHTYTTPRYRTEWYTEYRSEPVYRNEPVYATKFYFDIDRWVTDRTATSSGEGKSEPYWPELNLGENEREGRNYASYAISVEDVKKNKTYQFRLSEEQWSSLKIGEELEITYRGSEIIKINGQEIR